MLGFSDRQRSWFSCFVPWSRSLRTGYVKQEFSTGMPETLSTRQAPSTTSISQGCDPLACLNPCMLFEYDTTDRLRGSPRIVSCRVLPNIEGPAPYLWKGNTFREPRWLPLIDPGKITSASIALSTYSFPSAFTFLLVTLSLNVTNLTS